MGRAAHLAVAACGVTTSTTNGQRSRARAFTAYSGQVNRLSLVGCNCASMIAPNTGFLRVNSTTASARYSAGATSFNVASMQRALLNDGTSTASRSPSRSAANAGRSRTSLITPSCFNDTMAASTLFGSSHTGNFRDTRQIDTQHRPGNINDAVRMAPDTPKTRTAPDAGPIAYVDHCQSQSSAKSRNVYRFRISRAWAIASSSSACDQPSWPGAAGAPAAVSASA